jgi:hypothetical protein
MMSTATDPQRHAPRSFPVRLSAGEIVLSIGLIVAGLGVLTLFLDGLPGFPTVPPGPIIMIGIAVVVLLVRWRWIGAVGFLATVGISAGFIPTLSDAVDRLTDTSHPDLVAGTAAQMVGLAVALVGGVVAVVIASRAVRRERQHTS